MNAKSMLSGTNTGNIRYARNAVSTSGSITQTNIVVSSAFGKKLGVATINELDDASLEKVVRRSRNSHNWLRKIQNTFLFLVLKNIGIPSPMFPLQGQSLLSRGQMPLRKVYKWQKSQNL